MNYYYYDFSNFVIERMNNEFYIYDKIADAYDKEIYSTLEEALAAKGEELWQTFM